MCKAIINRKDEYIKLLGMELGLTLSFYDFIVIY